MAINYTTLFTRLGKIVKHANLWLAYQATLLTEADELLDQYTDRYDLVTGVFDQYQGMISSQQGSISQIKSIADRTLSDLQVALSATSNSPSAILPLMAADMIANAVTIKASTVTAPSSSAGGANVGTGTLYLSKLTVNGPVAGADDERAISESVLLTCVNDAFSGAIAGAEQFSIVGYPSQDPTDGSDARGSGAASIQVVNAANLVSNGNFESFTVTDTPDGWTIAAGAVTTNVKESATAYTGVSSVELLGDGATTTITLTQAMAQLQPRTAYVFTVAYRKGGTVNTGSTLKVELTSASVSALNKLLLNGDPNGYTTSYQIAHLFFVTGAIVPADYTLQIAWTSANSAGSSAVLYFDDLVLAQPTVFGNTQYALVRGPIDFVYSDAFTVTTANNYAGLFQTFFGRFYNALLPSSGSPSISDTLAA